MRSRVIFYKRESFKNSILNVCKIAAVNENVTDPQYQLRIIIYMPALHAILQEREGGVISFAGCYSLHAFPVSEKRKMTTSATFGAVINGSHTNSEGRKGKRGEKKKVAHPFV